MTARPEWYRIDLDVWDNPKLMRAIKDGGHAAATLWLRSIGYSTRHLTDGWVPLPLPKQWGYTTRHCDTLVNTGLWHPLQITDDGGWLINDYTKYQVTRQEWEAMIQRRREAARKRWAK